jgi:hypothetical protein
MHVAPALAAGLLLAMSGVAHAAPVVQGLPPEAWYTDLREAARLSQEARGPVVAVAGLVDVSIAGHPVTLLGVGLHDPCEPFAGLPCSPSALAHPLYVAEPDVTAWLELDVGTLHVDANGDGFEDDTLPDVPALSAHAVQVDVDGDGFAEAGWGGCTTCGTPLAGDGGLVGPLPSSTPAIHVDVNGDGFDDDSVGSIPIP